MAISRETVESRLAELRSQRDIDRDNDGDRYSWTDAINEAAVQLLAERGWGKPTRRYGSIGDVSSATGIPADLLDRRAQSLMHL